MTKREKIEELRKAIASSTEVKSRCPCRRNPECYTCASMVETRKLLEAILAALEAEVSDE